MASNSQLTLPRRTFDALPNHVWTLIISYLPRSSLPAVIATCKRFIKLATVPLYTPVVLHSEYSVLIKALETLCRQPSFARVVRVLVLRWTPSERPTDHTVFAKLLAYALKQTPSLEQLSVPQIPSIYHWMLAGVQLPKLTHLELSAYLAVNAQHFLESHRTSIQHLHLASEWAGTPAVVTKYHAHFSVETLARAKKLARLVVGVLPLAPSLVRAHAKTLTALALEDADESWHAAVDRAPLFRVCFEALAERAQLVHIALRHPHGLGSVARGIAGCCTLESVATVTLYVCPWAACRCSAARLVQKDAEHARSIFKLFPTATAVRFFCDGAASEGGRQIHDGMWQIIGALELERGIRPSVREIEYEGGARGFSAFWHAYDRDALPSRHPFCIIVPATLV